jgi:hypothetical protein
MAKESKIRSLCRVLLLAASIGALSAGAAFAQDQNNSQDQNSDLSDLNNQILDNPGDVALNLRYAKAAEDAGKLRLALAAYERILINDPQNQEARDGYERVRRRIEPGYTIARLEVGARWDSDPLNLPSFFFDLPESTTYYAQGMVANESELGGTRWRSVLNLDVEDNQDVGDLDYDYIGVQTGPVLAVGPHTAALPAIGVSSSWLGGDHYYNEVNVSFGMEGRVEGASYWWRVRDGYRDYDNNTNFFFGPVTEDGNYLDFRSGVTKPNVFSNRGSLVVSPFVRFSNIKGSVFDFSLFDELAPGKYLEYGVDADYNYQLTDHVQLSAGALWRQRDFRDSSRMDTFVSPQVSLTLQNVLPHNTDIKFEYRYRDNDSNSFLAKYNAKEATVALVTRF